MTDRNKQCGTVTDWHDTHIGRAASPEEFMGRMQGLCEAELACGLCDEDMALVAEARGLADVMLTEYGTDTDCQCKAGAEDKCINILCPRKMLRSMPWPIAMVIPPGASAGSVLFAHDLAQTMVNVGHGHDPYNYVGEDVVSIVIGVPC